MAGSTHQLLPDETLVSPNGRKIEFSIQRFLVRDVQLRPRIEKHEQTQHHTQKIYHRGENSYVNYTTTDTTFSTHEDTRLLLVDAANGEELVVDLYNVDQGYFRDDLVVMAMWRIVGEARWKFGYLQNHSRNHWYRWSITYDRVKKTSGRGVFPEIPGLIKLAVFLILVWPAGAEVMKFFSAIFVNPGNVTFVGWVLALPVAWFCSSRAMRWAERSWNAPLDQVIWEVLGKLKNAATKPPSVKPATVVPPGVDPEEVRAMLEQAGRAGEAIRNMIARRKDTGPRE